MHVNKIFAAVVTARFQERTSTKGGLSRLCCGQRCANEMPASRARSTIFGTILRLNSDV
jgi:hypothetical protein